MRQGPEGNVTRGTTNPNRLRRMDRWIAATLGPALRRSTTPPSTVDLGYGAAPWTAVELHGRLRRERADVRLFGVEIDQARVAAALPYAAPGLDFVRGGFELPLPGGGRPLLIRAANVLRQYAEDEVPAAWARLCGRLAPGGLLVEGTCDEIGRRHAWVALDAAGPRTLTLAARTASLATPSELAERLPKALIHRNVPGEPIHALLRDLDRAWASAAPYAAFGPRQRWLHAVALLAADWPVADPARRPRHGELTVPWPAVCPASGPLAGTAAARGEVLAPYGATRDSASSSSSRSGS